jgi:hypothetical protein
MVIRSDGSVLRVDRVDRAHPITYHGDTWYQFEGMQLTTGGAEIGHRNVLVRARRTPSRELTRRT